MPEFEFKCNDCGAISTFNKREDADSCLRCGSKRLSRVFSVPHIVKGRSEAGEKTLCCGRDSRPDSCPPGGCCHA
ncbi:FmdB family zinc ribbon protein [Moorella sulfitireducens]|uniref:FmdB family zinc ribbon protein n=1 Tax=Neomoorella sulfitireducens TaxID=2972948 RepID=UPI003BF58F8D